MSPALGSLIRRLRESADLSQEELAARAAVSRATIQSVENGRHAPRRASLKRIAQALGTDVTTLTSAVESTATTAAAEAHALRQELGDLQDERNALQTRHSSTFRVIARALDLEIAQLRARLLALEEADNGEDLTESGS